MDEHLIVFKDKKYKINSDVCLAATPGKLMSIEQWEKTLVKQYREYDFLVGDNVEISKYINIIYEEPNKMYERFYYLMHFPYLNLSACYWENKEDIPPDFVTAITFNYNKLWNTLTL